VIGRAVATGLPRFGSVGCADIAITLLGESDMDWRQRFSQLLSQV